MNKEHEDSYIGRLIVLNPKDIFDIPSVITDEFMSHGFSVSRSRVRTEQAAKELNRPCGVYTSISTGLLNHLVDYENACACLIEQLQPMLSPYFGKPLCICGIGNRNLVCDSLGLEVAQRIQPEMFELSTKKLNFKKIAVICPGIEGYTNLSSASIISSIASVMDAACVLTIDSCRCGDLERLCSTIQLSNAGMQTFAEKIPFNRASLGVPVVSIVVPTTIRTEDLSASENPGSGFFLTHAHVSEAISMAAFIIACAVIQIAYPELDYENCKQYIGFFLNGIV